MEQYVLGVDGGGTKTQCAIYDLSGNEIDIVNWGPSNHEVLKGGYLGLKSELALMITYLLKRNNLQFDQIISSVFGMAGVDTITQHEIISNILSELGFNNFFLCNDAYLGIKAGSSNGAGVGVVNGTGCCVAGIDNAGNMLQIGGMGMMTGDFGGGAYIGEKFIQAVYNFFFRFGDYTCMVDMLPDELKVASKFDFMDNVRNKIENGLIRTADLNVIVFAAANRGDRVALAILEEIGESLAASVNGCIREMEFSKELPLQIVLSGSVNLKADNPAITNTLKNRVYSINRDRSIEFIALDRLPVVGAVIWALENVKDRAEINRIFFNSASQEEVIYER